MIGSRADLELAASAFEAAPEPMLVLDASRRRIVTMNRRARELWGECTALFECLCDGDEELALAAAAGIATRLRMRCDPGPLAFDGTFTALGTHEHEHERVDSDVAWLLTLRPIARESADALMRARKVALMGEMARGVARDFKNVLQAISLAREELSPVDDPTSDGDLVLQGVGEALALGGDLLVTFNALAKDGPSRRRRPVCVNEAVGRCERLVRMLTRSVSRVEFDLPAENLFVECEEAALLQLVLNLVMHIRLTAVRGGGSHLLVQVGQPQVGTVEILIRDDAKRQAYQASYAADEAWEADPVLAVEHPLGTVRQLLTRLRGTLSVVSPLLDDRGCEFRVSLPQARPRVEERGDLLRAAQLRALLISADRGLAKLVHKAIGLLGLELEVIEPGGLVDLPPRTGESLALCIVDLDGLEHAELRVEWLAAAMSLQSGVEAVPVLLLAGPLEGQWRAQVTLLRVRGARLLRKPISASALLRAAGSVLVQASRDPDAPIPRMHEAS